MTNKLILAALAMVFMPSLQAATIHVPEDEPTIQAAVDASTSGDTIIIAAGTYPLTSPVTINGKAITLRGADGADVTFLDGNESSTLLFISDVGGAGVTIDGLTFVDGQATETVHGGCAVIRNSTATVINSKFDNCRTIDGDAGNSGGAIKISSGSDATIDNCGFTNNRSFSQGGAIHVLESTASITNSNFNGNVAAGIPESGGGGIKVTTSVGDPVLIQGNTFTNNEARFAGGAISVFAGDADIVNNQINDNGNGRFGGGIHLESLVTNGGDRNFTLINNVIENNFILRVPVADINPAFDRVSGAGVHINFGVAGDTTASTVEVRDNIIRNNDAADSECVDGLNAGECAYGGGIIFFNAMEALQEVYGNRFENNTADVYAGALFDKVLLDFTENVIVDNQARFTHPGMGCVSNIPANATSCRIDRNLFADNGYTVTGSGSGQANDSGGLNVRINNADVTNNVFAGNFGNLATLFVRHDDVSGAFSTVDHNTFVDNSHENAGFGVVRMQGEAAIRNNVFVGGNRALRVDNFTSSVSSEISGNNVTGMTINVARVEGTNFADVAALNAAPYASVNTELDPQFVNQDGGDYRLDDGSPLIDQVDCVAGVTTDFDGTSRPQGLRCDVGAFEWFEDPTIFADRFEH